MLNTRPSQEETALQPSASQGSAVSASVVAPFRSRAKRAVDVILSLGMLAVSAPVFSFVAIAIKLQDGGRVFYRQARWGVNGRAFQVHKFRTMVLDSISEPIRQATEDDLRVTRIGRFLRKTGLDELPQLLNILAGDMSFVGPRPLAIGETLESPDGDRILYEDLLGFGDRLTTRPGLTGLATIYLPKDAPPIQKFEYDLRYINEWSLWGDLKMIALSFVISFRGRWERRAPKL